MNSTIEIFYLLDYHIIWLLNFDLINISLSQICSNKNKFDIIILKRTCRNISCFEKNQNKRDRSNRKYIRKRKKERKKRRMEERERKLSRKKRHQLEIFILSLTSFVEIVRGLESCVLTTNSVWVIAIELEIINVLPLPHPSVSILLSLPSLFIPILYLYPFPYRPVVDATNERTRIPIANVRERGL